MRASAIRAVLLPMTIAPWVVAAACGGQQAASSAAPIVVEAPIASAEAPLAPASAAPPPAASATASASAAPPDDPLTVKGNMWGDAIGDSFGGGLGLSGTGVDGGARAGTGQSFGGGSPYNANPPSIRQGATTVNGRLPPEVIQRIARQNFGRFRLCYENGLRTNPKLAGQVLVVFVIDAGGAVKTTRDGGSTLPDAGVVSCIVRGFGNLSFPQPEKGEVTVTYPLILAPPDPKPPAKK